MTVLMLVQKRQELVAIPKATAAVVAQATLCRNYVFQTAVRFSNRLKSQKPHKYYF